MPFALQMGGRGSAYLESGHFVGVFMVGNMFHKILFGDIEHRLAGVHRHIGGARYLFRNIDPLLPPAAGEGWDIIRGVLGACVAKQDLPLIRVLGIDAHLPPIKPYRQVFVIKGGAHRPGGVVLPVALRHWEAHFLPQEPFQLRRGLAGELPIPQDDAGKPHGLAAQSFGSQGLPFYRLNLLGK